jgi:hypothetical protein
MKVRCMLQLLPWPCNSWVVVSKKSPCCNCSAVVQFNSLGNIAGFFGPWMLGVVVQKTCSYSIAYYIMGAFLGAAGLLTHLVRDSPKEGNSHLAKNDSIVEMPLHDTLPRMNSSMSMPGQPLSTGGTTPALEES